MTAIYLDNNATTQPSTNVREVILDVLGAGFGNPSSPNWQGVQARERLEAAREAVAGLLGADPGQIVFTSGCTESNSTVLRSVLGSPDKPDTRVVTSATEHASVRDTAAWLATQGVALTSLPVGPEGRLDPSTLCQALESSAALVSIQWVNSETGVIQPIAEIARICRVAGVPLHVDAAQAVGRLPISFGELGIDFLTLSGHKLHGPQGIGVTCAKDPARLPRLFHGGDQESGARAGTENLPGIVGLGEASRSRATGLASAIKTMRRLRDQFEAGVRVAVPDAVVNGATQPRVCNTSNIRFPVNGQALMAQLAGVGILCSQSSACASHSPEPSQVLTAIGLSRDEAFASVRFAVSVMNTEDEIETAVQAIATATERLRAVGI